MRPSLVVDPRPHSLTDTAAPQDHGATVEPVVLAQLTVRTGTIFSGQVSCQGRSVRGEDWDALGLQFSNDPNAQVTNTWQTGH